MQRILEWLRGIALLGIVAVVAAWFAARAELELEGRAIAVDGDSLLIGETRIRLQGIDAPELSQQCERNGKKYACGRQARDHLRSLIRRAETRCDGWDEDKYGRFLGTCSAAGVQLNRTMVADGWPVAFGDYVAEERAARNAGIGLWAGAFELPQEWRRIHQAEMAEDVPAGKRRLAERIGAGFAAIGTRLIAWLGIGKGE